MHNKTDDALKSTLNTPSTRHTILRGRGKTCGSTRANSTGNRRSNVHNIIVNNVGEIYVEQITIVDCNIIIIMYIILEVGGYFNFNHF